MSVSSREKCLCIFNDTVRIGPAITSCRNTDTPYRKSRREFGRLCDSFDLPFIPFDLWIQRLDASSGGYDPLFDGKDCLDNCRYAARCLAMTYIRFDLFSVSISILLNHSP